jgi:hypothetical protein
MVSRKMIIMESDALVHMAPHIIFLASYIVVRYPADDNESVHTDEY